MLALYMAEMKGTVSKERAAELVGLLQKVPAQISETLSDVDPLKTFAKAYGFNEDVFYIGRGLDYSVSLEGALKLKEISYIHAEGYPAAEMKHGPIALIDKDMPVVFIATNHSTYEKVISNIQEVKARNGKIIAVVSEKDVLARRMADYVIEIPETECLYSPLLATVPLQILAYHIAVMRGCNVDQPRNLAKSVTVE
jgi:glucosamine--fructose-6-phosphate aminotransferase (isomerizing)